MRRFAVIILALAGCLTGIMHETIGQIAKIHRKHASFEVSPETIVHGRECRVTVHPWTQLDGWRVLAFTPAGELALTEELAGSGGLISETIALPPDLDGPVDLVLEGNIDGRWNPLTEQRVTLMPGFLDEAMEAREAIETLERQALGGSPGPADAANPAQLRACWAALAHAEDLLERAKTGDSAWSLSRRLETLKDYAEALAEGRDPFEDQRGYVLRGYRSPVNGEIQLYSTYIPGNYRKDSPRPMTVMLHGAWSNHHLALRRVMGETNRRGEDDAAAKRSMPRLPDIDHIVLAPNGYETMGYEGFAEDDVWTAMDEMKALYAVDPNRVYLTGLSMGGGGTGKLGFQHPDRFAAIAPVCGYFEANVRGGSANRPAFQKRLEECASVINIAENLLHVPVKIMHGDADPVVPPEGSRQLHARLQELGYRSELEMYPGVDHDAWTPAYRDARMFEWFSQFERDPEPKKVVFETADSRGAAAYWAEIADVEKIRAIARVEADIEDNKVSVKTENVSRLRLNPPAKHLDAVKDLVIEIGGKPVYYGAVLEEGYGFAKRGGEWVYDTSNPTHSLRPGSRGLEEARARKPLFVYGTAGGAEATAAARALAVLKSMHGGNADVQWDVIPDASLTEDLLQIHDIVLFTTLNGCDWLTGVMDKLPLAKTAAGFEFAGKAIEPGQAVSFIYPNPSAPDRYIQANLAADAETLDALRPYIANPGFLRGTSPGDFIVFGNEGGMLWGGLFGKDWEIDESGDF